MNKAFVINVEIELVNDVVSTVEISVVIVGASLIDISILSNASLSTKQFSISLINAVF